MSVIIDGTAGVTFNDASIQNTAATGFGFKNRIINGAMVIDQRNNGASVTPTASPTYTVDRWAVELSVASKFSVQQNAGAVTPPVGFKNYLGFTSLSAYSVSATDYFFLDQKIEGFNFSDMAWGTASAQPITISCWVRSSLTGTFGGVLYNASGNRTYPFTYTISSANTWEQKTITIAGDTTGTWATDNSTAVNVIFSLGAGSTASGTAGSWSGSLYRSATGATSVVGTNGATFYITGVQLEKGSTATSFDYRPYGTELVLCQRYFQKSYDIETAVGTATRNGHINWNYQNLSNFGTVPIVLPVRMRAAPTATNYNPDLTNTVGGLYFNGTAEVAFTGSMNGWTQYQSTIIFNKNSTSSTNMLFQWTASAEL
jgi:hypothetical protein